MTGAEWLAVAAVAVGSGGVGGWISAWRTNVHQRTEADKERAHQRAVVSDERTYRARSEAYVDLLVVMTGTMNAFEATYPMVEPRVASELEVDEAHIVLAMARVGAHGSEMMNALMEEWADHLGKFQAHVETVESEEAKPDTGDAGGWRLQVELERVELREIVKRVRSQVRSELAGQVSAS
jgi:hypothetical protein